MKFVLIGAVLVIVLFVVGATAPRTSRKMQKWVGRTLRRGQGKSDRRGGRVGDWTARALTKTRRAADAGAEAGRAVNRKVRRPLG